MSHYAKCVKYHFFLSSINSYHRYIIASVVDISFSRNRHEINVLYRIFANARRVRKYARNGEARRDKFAKGKRSANEHSIFSVRDNDARKYGARPSSNERRELVCNRADIALGYRGSPRYYHGRYAELTVHWKPRVSAGKEF